MEFPDNLCRMAFADFAGELELRMLNFSRRRALFGLFLGLMITFVPTDLTAKTQKPWTKDSLTELLAKLVKGQDASFKTLEEIVEASKRPITNDKIEEQMKNLSEGDSIWFFTYKSLATKFMIAGTPNHIHTISVFFAPVNVSKKNQKEQLEFFPNLFSALLPSWEPAKKWPMGSLRMAWVAGSSSPFKRIDNERYLDDFVIRASHEAIDLSTAGVAPDIVVFRLSERSECNLRNFPDKMFQRWVC